MLNKVCKFLKQVFKKFDELFSLEFVVFLFLIFDYFNGILKFVKSFDEFTNFQWFVVVSFSSLVSSSIWLLCSVLEIKRFIVSKDDDKK